MKKVSGISMVELLVSIAISLILMQGMAMLFTQAWTANKAALEMGLASSMAQRASNKVITELRGVQQAENGAFPIIEANDFSLTMYTDIENDGIVERVHYYLDQASDELRMGVRNPDTTVQPPVYASGDETTQVIAKYIINTASEPIFYYYTDNYPTDTVALATPASVGQIQLVRLKLLVDVNPLQPPNNIFIETFVDLRNMHFYE